MLAAIIVGSVVRTSNGHCHINRVDGLVTIRHIEGNGCEVSVGVGELICCQTHVRRSGIRPRCSSVTAEREVDIVACHLVQGVACFCSITCHRVCCAIIVSDVVRTSNGHCHIDRINGLITIGNIEGHCAEVAVNVGELTCCQTHVRRSGIRSRC